MKSRRIFPLIAACALLLPALLANPGPNFAAPQSDEVSRAIRAWLEAAATPQGVWIGCEPIHAGQDLVEFYRGRDYRPVWVASDGPSKAARELVAAVGQVDRHGLLPQDYHFSCLSAWLSPPLVHRPAVLEAKELAGMDIVLADAFVNLATHLAAGKVDPRTIYPQWLSPGKKTEVFRWLADIAAPEDVRRVLAQAAPDSVEYRAAKAEARRLREVVAAGGWPEVAPGETLRAGDRASRVRQIRARLADEGDFRNRQTGAQDDTFFDADLARAVAAFQQRQGLSPDGAVGRETLAALNRSAQDRLRCVRVNLERWRWIPRDLGRRHIIVNAAAFELQAFREGRMVLEMPVIVGEAYTRTPVFSRDMTYLVVNPYWNVPPGVLARKILPKIKNDPGYLAAHHFELIRGWKEPAELMDPRRVDWSTVHPGNFPGRLRQRPGPWNSLGRIKFIFPNDFSVYLHDTPDRHLFNRPARAFSSGCIRVKKPVDLALFVLETDPSWSPERLDRTLAEGKPTTVTVKDPVTVHLLYWTFWVDPQGRAQYRKDIYDRDGVLWKALNEIPGASAPSPPGGKPEADPNVTLEPAA